MDVTSAQFQSKAHETLINIANVSKRLSTAFAQVNVNMRVASVRTRLDKIVVASRSILGKSLEDDSSFDPRLEDWLRSKEPDMCLHILSDMERWISTDLSSKTWWGKLSSFAVHSTYTEDKINKAIKLFNDRQDFFYFLLTPAVWNCENDIQPQLGTAPGMVPRISQSGQIPVQMNIDITHVGKEGQESGISSVIAHEAETKEGSPEKQKNKTVDLEKLASVLKWLDGFNCHEKHEDVVSLHQPNTCTWLPETDQYKVWRNSDDSFLWLQGKAGAGKTVLAASIIEVIKKTLQDGESIVFFYCDFRDERTTSAAGVMRSILSQLLCKLRNGTGQGLIQLVDDLVDGEANGTLVIKNAKSMATFVSRTARQFSRQPFIILDALDECQDLKSLLCALCELANGGMRLFVTSRQLQMINDYFRDLPLISMNRMAEAVSADIKLHVTRELDGDRRLRILEEKVKMEVLTILRNKADGMFRWIQCHIDTLKKCTTTRDIRTVLYSLPRGLDKTYERILGAIDLQSPDGKVALRTLIWLVAALRPLQLDEILEALSIDLRGRRLDHEIAPVHEYALLDALGSLVVYNEETGIINLSHFSVKEYLVGLPSRNNFHINMKIVHAQVAQLCMCYIAALLKHWTLPDAKTVLRDPDGDQRADSTLSNSPPLLDYVFGHGFRHLGYLESGNPPGPVIDGMIALRLDIEWHPVEWKHICELATLHLPYAPYAPRLTALASEISQKLDWDQLGPILTMDRKLPTSLVARHDFIICILMSSLPAPFLCAFLHRAPFKALDGTNPLIYAAYFGKIKHARILLSHGVDVNSTGLDIGSPRQVCPLEVALYRGHHSLFDLFLFDRMAAVPPQLFSAVFSGQYFRHTPRMAAKLVQCDEFVEWVSGGQQEQSLLHTLDYDWYLIAQSAGHWKEVLTVLRRFAQVGHDFSFPRSLELVLRVTLSAASKRSFAVFLDLCSLGVPMPSRALLIGGTTLVRELTLQGLDVNAIITHSDNALHRAFGKCKHGSSCWAPDCNLCSVFLRVIAPQRYIPVDVLLVGRKGAGKSTIINMILGVPDNLPGTAQVTNGFDRPGGTSQITSFATLLGSLPAQIWDTPGFDKALDDQNIRDKINDWLLQVPSSHSKHELETDRPYLNGPIVQLVWCMHAREIDDPITWQQFRVISEECRRRGIISMVLVNQLSTQSPSDWEVQCENWLQQLGLSASSGLLVGMRGHQGPSPSEYENDSQVLSQLIRQHALQNLKYDHSHGICPPALYPDGTLDRSFRCGWVTSIHPESTCNCIVREADLAKHLRLCHGLRNVPAGTLMCGWRDCGRFMRKESITRHTRMVHLGLRLHPIMRQINIAQLSKIVT